MNLTSDEVSEIIAKAIAVNAGEQAHMMLIILSAIIKASGISWRKISEQIELADWSHSPTTESCGELYKEYFRNMSKKQPFPSHIHLN